MVYWSSPITTRVPALHSTRLNRVRLLKLTPSITVVAMLRVALMSSFVECLMRLGSYLMRRSFTATVRVATLAALLGASHTSPISFFRHLYPSAAPPPGKRRTWPSAQNAALCYLCFGRSTPYCRGG